MYFQDHGGVILSISATLGYRGDALVGHAGCAKMAIGTYLSGIHIGINTFYNM